MSFKVTTVAPDNPNVMLGGKWSRTNSTLCRCLPVHALIIWEECLFPKATMTRASQHIFSHVKTYNVGLFHVITQIFFLARECSSVESGIRKMFPYRATVCMIQIKNNNNNNDKKNLNYVFCHIFFLSNNNVSMIKELLVDGRKQEGGGHHCNQHQPWGEVPASGWAGLNMDPRRLCNFCCPLNRTFLQREKKTRPGDQQKKAGWTRTDPQPPPNPLFLLLFPSFHGCTCCFQAGARRRCCCCNDCFWNLEPLKPKDECKKEEMEFLRSCFYEFAAVITAANMFGTSLSSDSEARHRHTSDKRMCVFVCVCVHFSQHIWLGKVLLNTAESM